MYIWDILLMLCLFILNVKVSNIGYFLRAINDHALILVLVHKEETYTFYKPYTELRKKVSTQWTFIAETVVLQFSSI